MARKRKLVNGLANNFHDKKKRHACSSSLDRITNLPTSILENILICLPLKEAAKTCILSKEWRHKWQYIPHLVFDKRFGQIFPRTPALGIKNILFSIFQVLLFHRGPLMKFFLSMPGLKGSHEIDQLILYLSGKDVQEITLHLRDSMGYNLPSSLFSCTQLRLLSLFSCTFKLPSTFIRFSKLTHVEFHGVCFVDDAFRTFISKCPFLEQLMVNRCHNTPQLEIDAPNLKLLDVYGDFKSISFQNTPLLATATVIPTEYLLATATVIPTEDFLATATVIQGFEEEETSNLIKIFNCLPMIENLCIGFQFLQYLAIGDIPKVLTTPLKQLKVLEFRELNLAVMDEMSSVLCLIRSSPSLRKLKFQIFSHESDQASINQSLRDHLAYVFPEEVQEVELELFSGTVLELEWVKFLLSRLSVLKRMCIDLKPGMKNDEQMRILRELTRFPRSSPNAEVIF